MIEKTNPGRGGVAKRAGALLLSSALLCLPLANPPAAFATVEGDQTPLSQEEIDAAVANGEIKLYSEDLQEATASVLSAARSSSPVSSFSGADRYDTNAMQAKAGWDSSGKAVVVTGERWPDALSVSGLAGALDCPVILVGSGSLSGCTKDALASLGVESVIVVGDEKSVDAGVVDALGGLGIEVEARLAGADRFATQMAVYEYGAERGLWGGTAIVASGADGGFADVLSVSAAAFAAGLPVFLAADDGSISDAQVAALRQGGFSDAVVLGGEDRVGERAEGSIYGALGKKPERIAGANRYDTSAKVADWSVGRGYLSWDGAAFATGELPYDALGGGALQGREGSVLLLASQGWQGYALDALSSHGGASSIKFFGGEPSISMSTRMEIADRLGFPYSDLDGLTVYLDAGHGFNSSNNGVYDGGAQGGGYSEAELTKELANLVADELRSYGIGVHVNDYGGWYELRQAEAERLGCDLLVSIHFNATGFGGASGSETYIHSYNAAWRSDALQDRVHPALVSSIHLTDRGQQQAELAVLNGNVPAVLCEVCFIDNYSDMQAYQTYKHDIARKIAESIAS